MFKIKVYSCGNHKWLKGEVKNGRLIVDFTIFESQALETDETSIWVDALKRKVSELEDAFGACEWGFELVKVED